MNTKDKLIEAIRKVPIAGKTYPEYIEAVAERILSIQNWNSVKDKLPEENGTYLVIGKSDKVHTAHFYKAYTCNGKIFHAHFSNRYVRYWQPLPETVKEETK